MKPTLDPATLEHCARIARETAEGCHSLPYEAACEEVAERILTLMSCTDSNLRRSIISGLERSDPLAITAAAAYLRLQEQEEAN